MPVLTKARYVFTQNLLRVPSYEPLGESGFGSSLDNCMRHPYCFIFWGHQGPVLTLCSTYNASCVDLSAARRGLGRILINEATHYEEALESQLIKILHDLVMKLHPNCFCAVCDRGDGHGLPTCGMFHPCYMFLCFGPPHCWRNICCRPPNFFPVVLGLLWRGTYDLLMIGRSLIYWVFSFLCSFICERLPRPIAV